MPEWDGKPFSAMHSREESHVAAEDTAVAFKALLFLLFVVFIAPQAIIPALEPLHLAKLSAGIAITAYCFTCMARGRAITVVNSDIKFILAFVVLALLSIPFSAWPGGSLNYFIDVYSKSVIFLFLVFNLLVDEKRCRQVIWAQILFCAFNSSIAIYRYLNGEFFAFNRVRGGFSGIADDPNDLALSLNLALPLIIYLFTSTRHAFRKALLAAIFLITVAGVVVTFSRGGFLGLLAIFVWLVWTRMKTGGATVFLKALVFVLLFGVMVPPAYYDRIVSIADSSKDYNGSREARWMLMKEAVMIAVEHPFGAGLKMHNILMKRISSSLKEVHSAFLEVAADLGFLGAILFAMIFWRLLRGMQKIKSLGVESTNLKSLAEGIEGSLIAFAVSGMFLPVAYHASFYILAGMALAVRELAKVTVERHEASLTPSLNAGINYGVVSRKSMY